MRKLKLVLEYDGENYHGFQLQPKLRTVQGELEKAIRQVTREKTRIIGAGRTDAGVHATHFVVSFKTKSKLSVRALVPILNGRLPDDIQVIKAEEVEDQFDARRSAQSRTYIYTVVNGDYLPVSLRRIAFLVRPRLNLAQMKIAAKYLEGRHDFHSFCVARRADENYFRKIEKIEIKVQILSDYFRINKLRVITFRITANSFLYRMVRSMVGTLLEVGLDKLSPSVVRQILRAKDRRQAGQTAPPQGLTLVEIRYQ